MKKFLIVLLLSSLNLWAKIPDHPDDYMCPGASIKFEPTKAPFLHQVHDKLVLGVCGIKDPVNGNYYNFDVYAFPPKGKPLYSNYQKDRKVLVMEKKDGLVLIEKAKIKDQYVELFKNELSCVLDQCKLAEEKCATFKKDKMALIYKSVKDKKLQAKLKKLGCV